MYRCDACSYNNIVGSLRLPTLFGFYSNTRCSSFPKRSCRSNKVDRTFKGRGLTGRYKDYRLTFLVGRAISVETRSTGYTIFCMTGHLNLFRASKPSPILIPSNFVPKPGFPVEIALTHLNLFRASKPSPILIPSNFVPKPGFPVGIALTHLDPS